MITSYYKHGSYYSKNRKTVGVYDCTELRGKKERMVYTAKDPTDLHYSAVTKMLHLGLKFWPLI